MVYLEDALRVLDGTDEVASDDLRLAVAEKEIRQALQWVQQMQAVRRQAAAAGLADTIPLP